jgi:hypothetical protein
MTTDFNGNPLLVNRVEAKSLPSFNHTAVRFNPLDKEPKKRFKGMLQTSRSQAQLGGFTAGADPSETFFKKTRDKLL